MRRDSSRRSILSGLAGLLVAAGVAGAGDVGVARYEAELTLHPQCNAVETRVYCLLRNDGPQEVGELSFDLLSKEKRCGARTTMTGVWQKADGKWRQVAFQRGNDGQDSSDRKLTCVTPASRLAPGATAELVFEYRWEASDPTHTRDNYRPFATLPNGDRELCLLSDFAWLPRVRTEQELEEAARANRFAKEIKPTWTLRVSAPKDYTVVALGGRHVRTEVRGDAAVSEWRSTTPIYPQLMAGRLHRQVAAAGSPQVVFYLPAGADYPLVPQIGRELTRACTFFRDMFGPLEGDEIHVAVSSAGQGGHGGYLSFTMDTNMLDRQITADRLPMLMEIMRHELAHSWWGWSVSSYGSGTKFLRESLANFANACFVEATAGQDRFAADMAKLFWTGMHTGVLCTPDGDSERLAYLKGPVVLNILRAEIGPEKFADTLRRFAAEHHGGHATLSDLIAVCHETTGTDWTDFFNQWCFNGSIPDYRLDRFESRKHGDQWTTDVTISNAGDATITCPLELRMIDGRSRESFRVEPGRTATVSFTTLAQVIEVVIDPDHRACQGSGRECRLKMLGVGDVDMEWIWYWRGVVLAEEGRYEEAIADISRAMAVHSHPAFSYSRGVAHLKAGDARTARTDFIAFLDAMTRNGDACRSLVYPGMLSPDRERQQEQLNRILQALTGQPFTSHEQWRNWWQTHREIFQPAADATRLAPGGRPQT